MLTLFSATPKQSKQFVLKSKISGVGEMSFTISSSSLSYLCSWFVGYGGGFNEREGVEYIQRQDSDDEFDEVSLDLG